MWFFLILCQFVSFLFLLHRLINPTIITPKKKPNKKTPPFKSTIQLAEWPWPNEKLKQNPKNPTHEPEPSGPPQEVKCYSSSSTSILVRWRPPPIESQNGIITQYTIHYAATEGEDTGTQQIHGISSQSSQYLLENLDKWTEYRVTVMAHTDVGAGPESLPQLIRTEEDGMCLLKPQLQMNFTLPPLNIQILTTATSSFSLPPHLLLIRLSSLKTFGPILDWHFFFNPNKLWLTLQKHLFVFFPICAAQFQHMVWCFTLEASDFQSQLSFLKLFF